MAQNVNTRKPRERIGECGKNVAGSGHDDVSRVPVVDATIGKDLEVVFLLGSVECVLDGAGAPRTRRCARSDDDFGLPGEASVRLVNQSRDRIVEMPVVGACRSKSRLDAGHCQGRSRPVSRRAVGERRHLVGCNGYRHRAVDIRGHHMQSVADNCHFAFSQGEVALLRAIDFQPDILSCIERDTLAGRPVCDQLSCRHVIEMEQLVNRDLGVWCAPGNAFVLHARLKEQVLGVGPLLNRRAINRDPLIAYEALLLQIGIGRPAHHLTRIDFIELLLKAQKHRIGAVVVFAFGCHVRFIPNQMPHSRIRLPTSLRTVSNSSCTSSTVISRLLSAPGK